MNTCQRRQKGVLAIYFISGDMLLILHQQQGTVDVSAIKVIGHMYSEGFKIRTGSNFTVKFNPNYR